MNHELRHYAELLGSMTHKELTARYKHTVFGFLWIFINPLLQMIVIGFIFPFFIKEAIPHYYLYLFIGLLTWNFFSLSLSKSCASIVNERSLIKKAAFPRSVIPVSIIFSNLTNYLIAFGVFLIPILFSGTLTIYSVFPFFGGLLMLVTFIIGISLLTSALNVRFRDINFFVQAMLIIWFYATPVIYSLSQIPDRLTWLWRLNPLTSILQLMQHALIGSALPEITMLTSNSIIIAVITVAGILIFREESKNFDDWL